MLRKIFILGLIFILTHFFAQVTGGAFNFKPENYESRNLGQSHLNIIYQLEFVKNKKQPNSTDVAICVLEIGPNYSVFADAHRGAQDSIFQMMSQANEINIESFNQLRHFNPKFKHIVLKDLKGGNLTIQSRIKKLYEYTKVQPDFRWELLPGSKVILEKNCKKAVLEFSGRKYTAWYAPDVAVNNGPYIFQGLPGLILELYDEKMEYHFSAVGINTTPTAIYWRTGDNITAINEKQFKSLESGYFQNPSASLGEARNEDGSIVKAPPRPYNPIELK